MQLKHLIIFALASIVVLIGFNIVNSNQHEKNRALIASGSLIAATPRANEVNSVSSADITSQPLGDQPKAIIDKATTQISQAQQKERQRLDQVKNSQ